MIEVVSAVIVTDGRILLTQRMPPRDFAFRWESPGGKVEPGETFEEAMRRELREELHVAHPLDSEVIGSALAASTFPKLGVRVHLLPVVLRDPADIRPLEGQGVGWFTAGEMGALPLAPCNEIHVALVAQYVNGWRPAHWG